MLNVAHRQDCILKKFKQANRFMETVKELVISKSTIYLKINQIKILDKYPKLKKFIIIIEFFKD